MAKVARSKKSQARSRKGQPLGGSLPDMAAERLGWIAGLIPEAVSDGKVSFDKLKTVLGADLDERPEGYNLSWTGKRDAIQLLQMPSRAALVPVTDRSVRFEDSQNLIIEGENLETLKLLYKAYFGQVKVVYIDPPYNTGKDFVYRDNFIDPLETYLRLTGQTDAEGNALTSNPETSGRYHSAWLSMMYPRLFLARQLLADDGVIFVSIDDNEVHNLRMVMNEVFGEENFVAQITILTNPKGRGLREHFAVSHDYLLVYTRTELPDELSITKTDEEVAAQYPERDKDGHYRLLELRNTHRQFGRFNRPNLYYPLYVDPKERSVWLVPAKGRIEVRPDWDDGFEGCWAWGKPKVGRDTTSLMGRFVNGRWKVYRKSYSTQEGGSIVRRKLKTIWTDKEFQTEHGQAEFDKLIPGRVFQSPKPVDLIKTCLELMNDPEAFVLDFFAGSGTSAQAVLQLNREDGGNRRFILVQLPEPTPAGSNAREAGFATIADICEERVRRVLASMTKGTKQVKLQERGLSEDLGFRTFRLVESHFKRWRGVSSKDPEEYAKQVAMFTDPLVPDADDVDVIWEVCLREGLAPASTIERLPAVKSNTVYRVTDAYKNQTLLICLDKEIKKSTIERLALTSADVFICRDAGLTDELAANLALQCTLKTV
jgi:adenine-specific DNA-methyltransferase